MSDSKQSIFSRFDRHPFLYCYLGAALYLAINNGINASSIWLEQTRQGESQNDIWEPILWEYSSAVSLLILLPLLIVLFNRVPAKLTQIPKQLIIHLLASVVFMLLHVGLMVWMREWVYHWQGMQYAFGDWQRELWYEYRKDAWSYLFIFTGFQVYRFVYSRLKGEANLIANEQNSQIEAPTPEQAPDFLLVKKLDREFLVKVSEIEWMESSGNYVNLHSQNRIYPLRGTLTGLVEKLQSKGFVRIHRSHAICCQTIDNMQFEKSGDGQVLLKSGKTLAISRRYKDGLRSHLTQQANDSTISSN